MRCFIRTTLGCGCPDDVLEWIECSQQSQANDDDELRLTRIDVGGRLLVYVIEAEHDPAAAAAAVPTVIASGLVERARSGFNRLRIVVAGRDVDSLRPLVEASFAASAPRDDRLHIHVVTAEDLPFD
jgi:hypothetical protein